MALSKEDDGLVPFCNLSSNIFGVYSTSTDNLAYGNIYAAKDEGFQVILFFCVEIWCTIDVIYAKLFL